MIPSPSKNVNTLHGRRLPPLLLQKQQNDHLQANINKGGFVSDYMAKKQLTVRPQQRMTTLKEMQTSERWGSKSLNLLSEIQGGGVLFLTNTHVDRWVLKTTDTPNWLSFFMSKYRWPTFLSRISWVLPWNQHPSLEIEMGWSTQRKI